MAYEIEKKSLEAHVEICAERYDNLERRLVNVEEKMEKIESHIVEIKDSLQTKIHEADAGMSKTMIAVGTTIIGSLIGAVITLIVHIK